MDFLTIGKGYGFLSCFPPFSFTVYSNFSVEIQYVREISRLSCGGDYEEKGGKLLRLVSRIRPLY
jgi:hypothetical protein